MVKHPVYGMFIEEKPESSWYSKELYLWCVYEPSSLISACITARYIECSVGFIDLLLFCDSLIAFTFTWTIRKTQFKRKRCQRRRELHLRPIETLW
jgi:hypothetical protein